MRPSSSSSTARGCSPIRCSSGGSRTSGGRASPVDGLEDSTPSSSRTPTTITWTSARSRDSTARSPSSFRGLGGLLERRGIVRRRSRGGGRLTVGAVTVRATHAVHDGKRSRAADGPASATSSGSRRIYFAGDTDLFPEMDGLVDGPRRRADPDLGLGPEPRARNAPRSARARRRRCDCCGRDRGADPLGHVPAAAHAARARFLRDPRRRSCARRPRSLAPEVEVKVLQPGEQPRALGAWRRSQSVAFRKAESVIRRAMMYSQSRITVAVPSAP